MRLAQKLFAPMEFKSLLIWFLYLIAPLSTRICTGSSVARLVCLGRATTTYDAQSNRSLLHCVLRLKLFTSSKASSHGPNKQGEQLSFLYISVLKHTKGL